MYIVSRVDTTIPPTTAVPMAIRWLQPSPVANASGISPKTVEALVIRIGASRAGGIVAEPRNAVVVENCFATGTLYSTGNAGGIAGGLNGNNPTIKGCIAWNEQIDGEPVSGRVIGWQSNTYTKATDCYAKKDMIIAWGPNKGMTGADANTAGTYDWGNNKTAICHGITTENSVDAAKKIGWSTDIWDLSGVTPLLKSFNDK